jgi:hypothetical protein
MLTPMDTCPIEECWACKKKTEPHEWIDEIPRGKDVERWRRFTCSMCGHQMASGVLTENLARYGLEEG